MNREKKRGQSKPDEGRNNGSLESEERRAQKPVLNSVTQSDSRGVSSSLTLEKQSKHKQVADTVGFILFLK